MTKFDRRQALAGLGTAGLGAVLAACGDSSTEPTRTSALDSAGSCRLTAEQAEGPFYFDVDSIRSDITENRQGTTLRLALRVREAGSCAPIANAVVDIWHCDAGGVYSGFDEGEGERFLRGAQVTDTEGIVEFTTIYPGWYPGRTPHIHAKVHLDRQSVLTTQVYFPDDVSEKVFASPPYEPGRDQTNGGDGIFDESLVLTVTRQGNGYLGAFSFDVQRT